MAKPRKRKRKTGATPKRAKSGQRKRKQGKETRLSKKTARTFPNAASKEKGRINSTPKVSQRKLLTAKLSQTPAAIAARKKRATAARAEAKRVAAQKKARQERRAIAEGIEAARLAKLERRRVRDRLRRDRLRVDPDERQVAIGWLERMQTDINQVFPVELDISEPGGGFADLEEDADRSMSRTPWLIVGRFSPKEADVGYVHLAQALQVVSDDLLLEVSIGHQRLSQIRVVFRDPNDVRREGDMVISKIGSWSFILGDLIGELVGRSADNPDEGSLAKRYKETTVPTFYIFLSSTFLEYKTVGPWVTTQKVKLGGPGKSDQKRLAKSDEPHRGRKMATKSTKATAKR